MAFEISKAESRALSCYLPFYFISPYKATWDLFLRKFLIFCKANQGKIET